MYNVHFKGLVKIMMQKAKNGTGQDVDFILSYLTDDAEFYMTRFVDYALSLVERQEGIDRIQHYLFNGTLIQRNYASLYFNRKDGYEWRLVKEAYDLGLVDEVQMYSR